MSALPLMERSARVVFVTSHQAHFIREVETMPEYLPVALSKRAGEDALRGMIDQMNDLGVDFVVVSGDMIEGTVTATLLNRANPGLLTSARNKSESSITSMSLPLRSPWLLWKTFPPTTHVSWAIFRVSRPPSGTAGRTTTHQQDPAHGSDGSMPVFHDGST